MSTLFEDARYGLRTFGRAPGFASLAILSLAIAIAADTTIFSVFYGTLLAAPMYRDPGRLVVIWEANRAQGIVRTPVAPATFRDWRESAHSFLQLELVAPGSPVTVTGSGFPERANIQYATPDLFKLLGVQPTLGRSFLESELKAADPIVLSYTFWQSRCGGDPSLLGQRMVVNGTPRTVVGILPREFHLFDLDTDIWMPITPPGPETQDHSFRQWLIAVGRLRPGIDLRSAQAEMNLVAQRIAQAHPDTNRDWGVRIEPIQEAQFGYWRPVLYLLFGIATFVLLISCTNVANLILGRLASRSREVSVRASHGATRLRLIAQFMNEGIILGLLGGGLGLPLAYGGVRLFIALTPASFPLPHSIGINFPVFLFCVGISTASGAVLSVTPALLGSRANLNEIIKATPHTAGGLRHGRYRRALVVAEVALSLVLLFGAGLMINSFVHLMRIDPGMRAERVLTMQIFLTGPRYDQTLADGVHIEKAVGTFYRRLLEDVGALPGVESAGLVSWLPEGGYNTGRRERSFSISGKTQNGRSQRPVASFNAVSADYFKTLQIPLLQGRSFTAQDDEGSPWVAIVNRAFVRRYWPGENPIGKQLQTDAGADERPRQVVGVVADVRQDTLEREAEPEIFAPFLQHPGVTSGHGCQNRVHMTLVVRTTSDSLATGCCGPQDRSQHGPQSTGLRNTDNVRSAC